MLPPSSDLLYVPGGLLWIRVERSPSPQIQRALFQAGVSPLSSLTPRPRKRSARPSLDDDLKLFSSCPHQDKENQPSGRPGRKTSRRSEARPLTRSQDTSVFRFPDCGVSVAVDAAEEEQDEVFCAGASVTSPGAGRPLLTPSTAHTPWQLPSLAASPGIDTAVCCSTPNRLRLEADGLSRDSVVLGRGAFGTVVLGRWRGRKVAVKVMEAEVHGTTPRRRKSLESELQARKLDHEHVVRVYAVHAVEQGHALVIMEYVGSRNLHRILVERTDKSLGRAWLLGAAFQVSDALQHCHLRGVLHLDVKAANVLVTSSGVCKLGDFGCSLDYRQGVLRRDQGLVGTPGYQAPEFLRGSVPSPACDVYSLGLLMWQLDSRCVPYPGQHPQTIMFRVVAAGARPALPSSMSSAVGSQAFTALYTQCWAATPEDRPSAKSVATRVGAMRSLPSSSLAPPSRLRSMR